MKLKQVMPTRVKVGGMEFYIRPFPAFKAANITGELASVLAPLLGALAPLVSDIGGKPKGSPDEGLEDEELEDEELENEGLEDEDSEEGSSKKGILDIDAGKAAEAMANCPAIDGAQMEKLMKKLLLGGHIAVEMEDEDGNTEVEQLTKDLADEIFCGNIQYMFALCFYVIRLNYKGFFSKLPNLSGKAKSILTQRKVL